MGLLLAHVTNVLLYATVTLMFLLIGPSSWRFPGVRNPQYRVEQRPRDSLQEVWPTLLITECGLRCSYSCGRRVRPQLELVVLPHLFALRALCVFGNALTRD